MATLKKIKAKRRDKPYLEQIGGPGTGRTFELSRDVLSIGRTEDNEIVMKSESVSRTHAYLKRLANGNWFFQDNSSKNGIRVNGERVLEARLSDGDTIVVGDFTFRFNEASGVAETRQEKTTLSSQPAVSLRSEPPPELERPVGVQSRRRRPPRIVDKPGYFRLMIMTFERNSWLAGLVAGVVIGGGVYFKASHYTARPGSDTVTVTKKLKAIIEIDPKLEAQIRGEEPVPEPAAPPRVPVRVTQSKPAPPPAPTVRKEDLNVAAKADKKSDIRDVKVYLREGRDYLKEGDKESAAVAFRFALVLDPNNKEAKAGLKSAGVKVEAPKSVAILIKDEKKGGGEAKKKAKVADLLKAANEAFSRRNYQEAIDKAEQARKVEIAGKTDYLNEAKQIIDRARQKQKEDFEPFLESALQKIQQGDFKGSAALCEEMLRTDPSYAPARECLAKSLDGIAHRRPQ